jgi:hypothetical protein
MHTQSECVRTLLGLPVELDKCLPTILSQHLEGVHAKARHGAVALGDADVIQQESQLQCHVGINRVIGQAYLLVL